MLDKKFSLLYNVQEISKGELKMKAITTTATQLQTVNNNLFGLVERWLTFAQVSKSSLKSYEKGIKRLQEYFAAQAISEPTREVLINYRAYLQEKYSPATCNLYLSAARLFFQFLATEGILKADITTRIKSVKIRAGHKKDALTAAQVKNIFAQFDTSTLAGLRDRAIFAICATAGTRTIEIARADKADVIERNGQYFLLVQGKGHFEKDDSVKLAPRVYQLLKEYLAARSDEGAALFASVSRRNYGGRMTTTSISRIIKSAMKSAGFDSKRWTAHSLRHTAATTALISNASLRDVQQMLRHSNIAVTQNYLHDLDRLNNNAELLNAAAFGL